MSDVNEVLVHKLVRLVVQIKQLPSPATMRQISIARFGKVNSKTVVSIIRHQFYFYDKVYDEAPMNSGEKALFKSLVCEGLRTKHRKYISLTL